MSEQGWLECLAAEGVDDWVVLHGGATAAFRRSIARPGGELAEAVSRLSGLGGSGALMTISGDGLGVRLTRGVFRLEVGHLDLARAVSAAGEHGGVGAASGARGPVGDRRQARGDRCRLRRAVLGYSPRTTTTPSIRSVTGRRSGCRGSTQTRRCGTRCTSTCPWLVSRSALALQLPWRQEAASSKTPMPRRAGSSPTPPGTACALPRGQTDLFLHTPERDPSRASSKRTPSPSTVLVDRHRSSSRPWRCATAVASVRVEAPSLARMRETWTLAVLGEMKSVSAI